MFPRSRTRTQTQAPGRGVSREANTNRRNIQDVLGQARAALRQSQQLRPSSQKTKNEDNFSSRLAFQQQPHEDYWSSLAKDKQLALKTPAGKVKAHPDDGFGRPFREEVKRKPTFIGSNSKTGQQQQESPEPAHVSDSSTTTMSLNTNDLRVTSDSNGSTSSEDLDSIAPLQKPEKPLSATRQAKIDAKMKEWSITPHVLKVLPHGSSAPATTPVASTFMDNNNRPGEGDDGAEIDDTGALERTGPPVEGLGPPKTPTSKITGEVEEDVHGFSRAHIVDPEEDPHWFEKAIWVRRDSLSDAAYKAFKKAQQDQAAAKKVEAPVQKVKKVTVLKPKKKELAVDGTLKDNNNLSYEIIDGEKLSVFNNNAEPEFTADWLSDDMGATFSRIEVDIKAPAPTVVSSVREDEIEDEVDDDDVVKGEVECDIETSAPSAISDVLDVTASMIRTATELEASGMLEEITENLKGVMSLSATAGSQDGTTTNVYDQGMVAKNESPPRTFKDGEGFIQYDESKTATDDDTYGEEEWDEWDEEDYENTFIMPTDSLSDENKTFSKRASVSISSKRSTQPPSKSTTPSTHQSGSKGSRVKKDSLTSYSTSKSKSISQSQSQQPSSSISTSKKSKKSVGEDKSKVVTSSILTNVTSSRRPVHVEHGLDPPTSRYQKSIQNILEKEVYQKELKKLRSEKIREERDQQRLQAVARVSLERNKTSKWKDPDYTEILLPELFKYKSVSGLQAAKSKRSAGPAPINFGSPYFKMNGAVSEDDSGATGLLAEAKIASLDIPNLVREVLASNERMYNMTVQASEQMNNAYKDKVKRIKATAAATAGPPNNRQRDTKKKNKVF